MYSVKGRQIVTRLQCDVVYRASSTRAVHFDGSGSCRYANSNMDVFRSTLLRFCELSIILESSYVIIKLSSGKPMTSQIMLQSTAYANEYSSGA